MPLLDNQLAPVTFEVGFIESDLETVVKAFVRWQHMLLRTINKTWTDGSLDSKIRQVLPIDDAGEQLLFTETRGNWTAVFDNRLGGGIANNAVAVVSERMSKLAVHVINIPNTFKKSEPVGNRGVWGSLGLTSYGPSEASVWGATRSVSLTNDVGGWKFKQFGRPWPFEDATRYSGLSEKAKLDESIVAEYCRKFGIDVFSASFYEGRGVVIRSRFPISSPAKTYDLMEIRRKMRLISISDTH